MTSKNPDFSVDFESEFNSSCGSDDVSSPPTPEFRKRTPPQHQVHDNDSFLQPEPIKKQKTFHYSHDQSRMESGQSIRGDCATVTNHQEGYIHQDSNVGDTTSISDEKSRVEAILRELGQDVKMLYLKWTQPFLESEAFEALCPARLDELLKEANKLEQHLKNEKENMRERLTLLTRTLQMI